MVKKLRLDTSTKTDAELEGTKRQRERRVSPRPAAFVFLGGSICQRQLQRSPNWEVKACTVSGDSMLLRRSTSHQGHSQRALEPRSEHDLPGTCRLNAHTSAQTKRRTSAQRRRRGRRRRFNVGRVPVLNAPRLAQHCVTRQQPLDVRGARGARPIAA